MWTLIVEYQMVLIFAVLATAKSFTEYYAYRHQNRQGGSQSSTFISRYFIVVGSLTPLLILAEIFIWQRQLPLALTLPCAAIYLATLALRILSVRELGRFYSVNIRVLPEHELIQTGIYRYLRHPIYLIALLENIVYPLAASAIFSAVVLTILMTPAILIRRQQEEERLVKQFGAAYLTYQDTTWF